MGLRVIPIANVCQAARLSLRVLQGEELALVIAPMIVVRAPVEPMMVLHVPQTMIVRVADSAQRGRVYRMLLDSAAVGLLPVQVVQATRPVEWIARPDSAIVVALAIAVRGSAMGALTMALPASTTVGVLLARAVALPVRATVSVLPLQQAVQRLVVVKCLVLAMDQQLHVTTISIVLERATSATLLARLVGRMRALPGQVELFLHRRAPVMVILTRSIM